MPTHYRQIRKFKTLGSFCFPTEVGPSASQPVFVTNLSQGKLVQSASRHENVICTVSMAQMDQTKTVLLTMASYAMGHPHP